MFEGVYTAIVTPFRDGAVDERALRELIEIQVAAGVDGICPCGTTGESATLTHAEHQRVVEVSVAAARGRIRVVAGTGSNSTREAIELTRYAKEAGADGALLISPYYNRPTQAGIFEHYARIARETAFPLVIYNIPKRTASLLEPETIARLADLEQIVGVKEATGDMSQVSHVLARCPAEFSVLAGDDVLTLPMLALGSHGVISTAANVAPGEVVELVRAFRAGDLQRARQAHLRLLPLMDALFCETNPIPVKAALEMRGLIDGELRLPLVPLSEANRDRLQVVLKEHGLL
ncbi:MAG: 4-hydroxy-tetrahydrodipicolinate synthase [Myxococcota bacterium]|nr:4-hydroxy-tetrahydrodipicolinate synthase [Myxococcota bacterium]